jgi:hypothetical protein
MRISGAFHAANGLPAAPVESVTFSIYKDESDPSPLWQENQNVALDAEGRYSALLGASLPDGLPADLFSAAEQRWLSTRFNRAGENEQSRVLLVSVPYALKAADADTLGGRPASAYLLSPVGKDTTDKPVAGNGESTEPTAPIRSRASIAGSTNCVAKFLNGTDVGCALMAENNGGLGIGYLVGAGLQNPYDTLHVQINNGNGVFTGYAVQNMSGAAAAYSGMLFYDQNGSLGLFQGFNNSTHEYRINNQSANGSINFMIGSSSKFKVANNGNIGISNSNPVAKLDVNGSVQGTTLASTVANGTAPLTVNSTTQVDNLNASFLGGMSAAAARTRGIVYLAGCDTCSALADTDSQKTIYYNVVGPMTITSVTCFSDNGAGTINLKRDDGTPATILGPDLGCSVGGTTTAVDQIIGAESVLNLNDKVDFVMVAAGGAKRITVAIKTTVN